MNRFATALLVALCAVLLTGATASDVQSDPRLGRQQQQQGLRNRQLVSNPEYGSFDWPRHNCCCTQSTHSRVFSFFLQFAIDVVLFVTAIR